MKIDRFLAGIPLFKGLPEEQIARLAEIAVEQRFQRHRVLFHEGKQGIGFYAVISGKIKVFKLSPDGREQILHVFGSGEPFGEVPVFSGGHYPASAQALNDVRVLFFPRDAFVRLVREEPSLALNMLAVLSRRLREFTRMVENLSLREVPGRLAAYLLQCDTHEDTLGEVRLEISKGQLASLLGTIPETLSRILGRMAQRGLIEVRGRTIRLVDRDGLAALASGEKLQG